MVQQDAALERGGSVRSGWTRLEYAGVCRREHRSSRHAHAACVPLLKLGLDPRQPSIVEDLLDEARYTWQGEWNYVKLDPAERMAHIFIIRTRVSDK